MQKINVMHVVYSLYPGGLENGVVNQVNSLDLNRFNPSICCFLSDGALKERVNKGIEIIEIQHKINPKGICFFLKLKKIFKEKGIHIVHTHNWGTCCDGIIGARLASVPIVIHQEHGTFVATIGNKKRRILAERLILRYVDQVMSISEDLKKKMVEILSIPTEKINVIVNGVDVEKFNFSMERRQKKRRELGIGDDELVIGTIGRLEPVKNHKMFLQAMPELLKRFPTIKAILVGNGSLRQELTDMAKRLGISEKVLFLGIRNDVSEILFAMDLFVNTSLTEGICNAILEAMACGLPVIATAVGGNPEIVHNEETGLLFPTEDVAGLVRAIERMLEDEVKRKEYGQNGRKLIEEKFSLQRMVSEYEALYEYHLRRKGIV